jgi:hypothetical protein
MNRSIKLLIFLTPLLFFGFAMPQNREGVEFYYNFQYLKDSGAPKEMKIVRLDNIVREKTVIEYGVLITYKDRYAKDIKISGDFSNWRPLEMSRGKFGVWYYFLKSEKIREPVRYKFIVDGIWIPDPENREKEDDKAGSYVSVIDALPGREGRMLTYRFITPREVEFRIYKPDAKFVSIVGDFNNWNPENDLLEKDDNGVWALQKRLSPGLYRYKYIVDGDWTLDLYNEKTASDDTGDICSLISINK